MTMKSGEQFKKGSSRVEKSSKGTNSLGPLIRNRPSIYDHATCCSGIEITWLRPSGPFRPPDFRSRLAAFIATYPDRRLAARLSTWADARTQALVELQDSLTPEHPLAKARWLLAGTQPVLLTEVESRLLAGQTSSEIAAATGIDAEVVEWHHHSHFSVRDRLGAAGHIVHTILGQPPQGNPDDPPLALCYWFGFFGGPIALEAVLDIFKTQDQELPTPITAEEWRKYNLRQQTRAAFAARLMSLEEFTKSKWYRLMMNRRLEGGVHLPPPAAVLPSSRIDSFGFRGFD